MPNQIEIFNSNTESVHLRDIQPRFSKLKELVDGYDLDMEQDNETLNTYVNVKSTHIDIELVPKNIRINTLR